MHSRQKHRSVAVLATLETPGPPQPLLPAQSLDTTTEEVLNQLTLPPANKFFIRFDHKGPAYPCVNNSGVFNIVLPTGGVLPRGVEDPGVNPTPPGSRPVGLTFEITRSPSKSIVAPLTLPGDARVIDLTLSGVGVSSTANNFQTALPNQPIIIMFGPSGQTGSVFVNNDDKMAGGSVYLFIGRRSKVMLPLTTPSSAPLGLSIRTS